MLRAALLFGAGYVLGAKAARERYAQIEEIAKKVSARYTETGAHRVAGSSRA